jgi:hypothetical protein
LALIIIIIIAFTSSRLLKIVFELSTSMGAKAQRMRWRFFCFEMLEPKQHHIETCTKQNTQQSPQ